MERGDAALPVGSVWEWPRDGRAGAHARQLGKALGLSRSREETEQARRAGALEGCQTRSAICHAAGRNVVTDETERTEERLRHRGRGCGERRPIGDAPITPCCRIFVLVQSPRRSPTAEAGQARRAPTRQEVHVRGSCLSGAKRGQETCTCGGGGGSAEGAGRGGGRRNGRGGEKGRCVVDGDDVMWPVVCRIGGACRARSGCGSWARAGGIYALELRLRLRAVVDVRATANLVLVPRPLFVSSREFHHIHNFPLPSPDSCHDHPRILSSS